VTDVYEFDGGVFHPRCLVEAMIRRGELSPAARDLPTADVLWQFAQANAVTVADVGGDWLPRRVTVTTADADERECSGCERLLTHDVSVSLRPDPVERATGQRPTSREIADLLGEYRQMIADADGWASRVPRDRLEAWLARKRDLLARIEAYTDLGRSDDCDRGGEQSRGCSL
jgi:hypothetical protein